VRLQPDEASYHAALSETLVWQEHLPQARKEMQEAVRLDPESAADIERLGDIDVMLNDLKSAETDYTRALKLADSVADYHVALAQVLRYRGKTGQALREDARAKHLRIDPKTPNRKNP
jgi:cytochrome c-type biogenesis protein CcmH/NrfG